MSKYVEFSLEGGGSILIEAAEEPSRIAPGFARSADAGAGPQAAQQSFDASIEVVRKSADLLVSKLRGLSVAPDEMEVKFGLKASGELGALAVAKGTSEANFSVTLKWGGQGKEKSDAKDDDKKDKAN